MFFYPTSRQNFTIAGAFNTGGYVKFAIVDQYLAIYLLIRYTEAAHKTHQLHKKVKLVSECLPYASVLNVNGSHVQTFDSILGSNGQKHVICQSIKAKHCYDTSTVCEREFGVYKRCTVSSLCLGSSTIDHHKIIMISVTDLMISIGNVLRPFIYKSTYRTDRRW